MTADAGTRAELIAEARKPTESETWARLCEATVRLAVAFADFEKAKDDYARARQEGMTVA